MRDIRKGVITRQYGIFLYYIAEIESLTIGVEPLNEEKTEYDWGLIETGINLIGDRKEHNCNDSKLLIRAQSWVRRIYPMIAMERVFYNAMCDNRLLMIEKHHY